MIDGGLAKVNENRACFDRVKTGAFDKGHEYGGAPRTREVDKNKGIYEICEKGYGSSSAYVALHSESEASHRRCAVYESPSAYAAPDARSGFVCASSPAKVYENRACPSARKGAKTCWGSHKTYGSFARGSSFAKAYEKGECFVHVIQVRGNANARGALEGHEKPAYDRPMRAHPAARNANDRSAPQCSAGYGSSSAYVALHSESEVNRRRTAGYESPPAYAALGAKSGFAKVYGTHTCFDRVVDVRDSANARGALEGHEKAAYDRPMRAHQAARKANERSPPQWSEGYESSIAYVALHSESEIRNLDPPRVKWYRMNRKGPDKTGVFDTEYDTGAYDICTQDLKKHTGRPPGTEQRGRASASGRAPDT